MRSIPAACAIAIFIFLSLHAQSQNDSLVFANGKYLVGEIKTMQRGVVTIETSFSDADFQAKWEEVKEIFTPTVMIISTTDGQRHYGNMRSDTAGTVSIQSKYEGLVTFSLEELVYIKPIDKTFLDRLNAAIDLGYTRTRARNQRQFTLRSRVGYLAERYTADASYNALTSFQDDADDIDRSDANVNVNYILKKSYFAVVRMDFLSNTEQLLDLRSNYKVGLGKFLLRKNTLYWHFSVGGSIINENFTGLEGDRRGNELWLGTELNLFNIGDFNLFTNAFVYPSLTEEGRLRLDIRSDLKYDLPLDFYIKTGVTLNYDNRAVEGAAAADYVWQTTFGWSW